jgi:hypothetical protein
MFLELVACQTISVNNQNIERKKEPTFRLVQVTRDLLHDF